MLTLSTNIRFNFFHPTLHSAIGKDGIGISFDDGPHPNTLKILDILDTHEAKAVFFCIGERIRKYPEIYQEILKRGHVVGNHTYTHPKNFGFLSTRVLIDEIKKCDQVAFETAGLHTRLFRPPFGVINPRISKAISDCGHVSIGWSVRSYDAITKSPQKIFDRITRNVKNGDLILLHDNIPQTSIVLEQLLVFLKQQQLSVKRPDHLLEIHAYS